MATAGIASLARADAPGDQYGLFNSNNQVIQDVWTGLYWERYPTTVIMDNPHAAAYCGALSLEAGPSSTGWRLPSYKELLTIVDESPHTEYENGQLVDKALDANAFPGASVFDAPYWSSSRFPQGATDMYVVDFIAGIPRNQPESNGAHVRCVHD